MTVPYVHSSFDRIEDDNYQTIDKRCVYALGNAWAISETICDVCSPNGSGILNTLSELGFRGSFGLSDAFAPVECEWIVSNPPYKRGLVDKIIAAQLDRLGDVKGVAMLLRNNFAFAKSRWDMFAGNPYYACEIKMLFRPWWSEDRKAQPIHNYVWHIWTYNNRHSEPIQRFWREG